MALQLLTVDEAAQLLRVSRDTVYRLAASGALPGRRVGRLWRFPAAAIESYLCGDTDAAPARKGAGTNPLPDDSDKLAEPG